MLDWWRRSRAIKQLRKAQKELAIAEKQYKKASEEDIYRLRWRWWKAQDRVAEAQSKAKECGYSE